MKLINLLRQMQTLLAAVVKQEGVYLTAEEEQHTFLLRGRNTVNPASL